MRRRPKTVEFWVGRLPHWEVEEGRYFVTIHLAGAIPDAGRRRIRGLAQELQVDKVAGDANLQVHRQVFTEMERWLDRAPCVEHLTRPAVAETVIEAIEHRAANNIWRMFESVLMPNHVHLFFELVKPGLKRVLEDFKRWTGRHASAILDLDERARFWQREWFDHWSRSDEEDDRIVRYIAQNPGKASLVKTDNDWKWRFPKRGASVRSSSTTNSPSPAQTTVEVPSGRRDLP
ncbi:MAG: transposase [Planctomycetaceae bacterium]